MKILCPFCNAPYTENMLKAYNGTYGCDSGCEFYRVVVVCESCKREIYVKGDFGGTSYTNWKEEVTEEEIIEAIKTKEEY